MVFAKQEISQSLPSSWERKDLQDVRPCHHLFSAQCQDTQQSADLGAPRERFMVHFPAADGYRQPVLGLTFWCLGLGQVRQELLTQVTPNVGSLLIQLKPNLLPGCWELVARRPCANTSPTCDQASPEGVCLQVCTSKKKFF